MYVLFRKGRVKVQNIGGEEGPPDLRQIPADLCNLGVRGVGSHKQVKLPRLLKQSRKS